MAHQTDLLKLENSKLRQQLKELQLDTERAKSKVSEYVYNNNLEKEDLQNKIKFLREEIEKLYSDIKVYTNKPAAKAQPGETATSDAAEAEGVEGLEVDEAGDIKAGTTERLVQCLYTELVQTPKATIEYATIFLLTYRSFTTARYIIQELLQGYNKAAADPASKDSQASRLRIGNFLKKWANENFHDFEEDEEIQNMYMDLVSNTMSKADARLGQTIARAFEDRKKGVTKRHSQAIFSEPAPAPVIPKGAITSLVDINPLEVARQLTLIDYEYCRSIEPKECLGMAWTKENKKERSPNLLKTIERFNQVSKWIAFLLVSEMNLKKRAKLLSHILQILQHLKELNNFSAIFQIVGGLGNSSVHRLQKTFSLLKPAQLKILEDLRYVTKPEKSWANYRRTLHTLNPPCVPFLGVYQTDLTFIEDGNPSKFASGLINFKKCRLVASVIIELQQYQQKPYNLKPEQVVEEWLTSSQSQVIGIDDKKLYALSLEAEPRAESTT